MKEFFSQLKQKMKNWLRKKLKIRSPSTGEIYGSQEEEK